MGLITWVGRLLLPIARKAFSPSDTSDDQFRKLLMVSLSISICVVTGLLCVTSIFKNISLVHYVTGAPVTFAGFAASLVYMVYTKRLSNRHVGLMVLFLALNVFVMDWRTYGKVDVWSMSLLAMDLLLLCACDPMFVTILKMLTLAYLVYEGIEQATHMTYDSLPPLSVIQKDKETRDWYTVFWAMFVRAVVFLLDFTMTRFFAVQMRKEQERMRSSIELTEQVATSLVAFDLTGAEEVLAASPPSELTAVLGQLLGNLHSYRPYLPDALFVTEQGREREGTKGQLRQAPPEGEVALVFTDIEGSTETWEACPRGMRRGIATHNSIMRRLMEVHSGYEVKTIGDAFMVAFDTVRDACAFCLDVQTALYESSEWSPELLALPQCADVGAWNGLRVRMGVHVGYAVRDINPVTGRADYFGTTVNTAARVERQAWSGTVAVTRDVLQRLGPDGLGALGEPVSLPLGEVLLRGLGATVDIILLVPRSLQSRLDKCDNEVSPTTQSLASFSTESVAETWASKKEVQLSPLRSTTATVASVRVDYACLNEFNEFNELHNTIPEPQSFISDVLSTVIDNAGRMRGQLASFSNFGILVTWNAAQSCPTHAIQGALFAGALLRSRVGVLIPRFITAGVASGPLLHGPVGNATQRFVADIGQCIDIAGGLAAAAWEIGAFALIGAVPGYSSARSDPRYKPATRKVGEWEVHNGVVEVYELSTQLDMWGTRDDPNEDARWGWSEEYCAAFDSRDTALIRAKASVENDAVASSVADLMAAGACLSRPLPQSVKL